MFVTTCRKSLLEILSLIKEKTNSVGSSLSVSVPICININENNICVPICVPKLEGAILSQQFINDLSNFNKWFLNRLILDKK